MFLSKWRAERQQRQHQAEHEAKRQGQIAFFQGIKNGGYSSRDWYNFCSQLDHNASRLRRFLTDEELAEWRSLREQIEADTAFSDELVTLKQLQKDYQSARRTPDEIDKLRNFINYYWSVTRLNLPRLEAELGVKRQKLQDSLTRLVRRRYNKLFALREDRESFADLWELIGRTRRFRDSGYGDWHDRDLRKAGVQALPFPEDWNDLVARHINTPTLENFRDLPERLAGDVRLLAADAIREDDFTLAQIALAYCNHDPEFRSAVGDVLTAELAKLVVRHRASAEVKGSDETKA